VAKYTKIVKLRKTARFLFSGLYEGLSRYRRSLQPALGEHPALENIIYFHFCLFLCVIVAFLDPDPQTQLNSDPF
jgi:hypothetical protein